MRPLTLNDFCDAEGSTLTLTDPDPEDEPLPLDADGGTLTEEKRLVEVKEDATNSIDNGVMSETSNDESVDLESR